MYTYLQMFLKSANISLASNVSSYMKIYPISANVSYISKCILYRQMYPISANVYCFFKCTQYLQMYTVSSNVPNIWKCILHMQIYPISANVYCIFKCILYMQIYLISPNVSYICKCNIYLYSVDVSGYMTPVLDDTSCKDTWRCLICTRVIKRKYRMKDHIESRHFIGTPCHPCSRCGKLYSTKNSLEKHISTYHKEAFVDGKWNF